MASRKVQLVDPADNPVSFGAPSPYVLTTFSSCCLGDIASAAKAGIASNVFPAANLALFFPFRLVEGRTFTGMIWENGATVAGNVNGALYDTSGNALTGATIGSVAQSGTSASQKKAFAAAVAVPAGSYFLGFSSSDGTATFARSSLGAAFLRMAGVRQLASFFALTASATAWVGAANGFLPLVGLYEASWL